MLFSSWSPRYQKSSMYCRLQPPLSNLVKTNDESLERGTETDRQTQCDCIDLVSLGNWYQNKAHKSSIFIAKEVGGLSFPEEMHCLPGPDPHFTGRYMKSCCLQNLSCFSKLGSLHKFWKKLAVPAEVSEDTSSTPGEHYFCINAMYKIGLRHLWCIKESVNWDHRIIE